MAKAALLSSEKSIRAALIGANPDAFKSASKNQATSNRSRSITLYQAATKSATNFSFASSLA